MLTFDIFALELLEQSKRFLEKASSDETIDGRSAFLNASLLLLVSSLEAHINSIVDEQIQMYPELDILELSILKEKEFELRDGKFSIKEQLKMYKIVDRIEFLFNRFGKYSQLDKSEQWWGKFIEALRLRNELVHPKKNVQLSEKVVEDSIEGIMGLLNQLYLSLYNRQHPANGRRLDSNKNF